MARCPACSTPHHTLCFNECGCTVLGCSGESPWAIPKSNPGRRLLGRRLLWVAAILFFGLGLRNLSAHPARCSYSDCNRYPVFVATKMAADEVVKRRTWQSPQGFSWHWDMDPPSVQISSVQPNSWAERAGFQPGDRITHLLGQPVERFPLYRTSEDSSHCPVLPRFARVHRVDGLIEATELSTWPPFWVWWRWLPVCAALPLAAIGAMLGHFVPNRTLETAIATNVRCSPNTSGPGKAVTKP